jgi:hypothetical protein
MKFNLQGIGGKGKANIVGVCMLVRNVCPIHLIIFMYIQTSVDRFRREGIMWQAAGNEPHPAEVTCYGIASAFTPPEHRRNGYAKHMMSLLHWVLAAEELLPEFPAEWGSPPPRVHNAGGGLFSTLWSDVGKDLYRRCGIAPGQEGWLTVDPISTSWKVQPKGSVETKKNQPRHWVWLGEDAVLKLWDRDAERITNSLEVSKMAPVSLAVLPHKGVAAFQHRRNEFFLKKQVPPVEHYGIISPGSDTDPLLTDVALDESVVFATWTMEVFPSTPSKLIITRLRSRAEDFGSLLAMIMEVARKHSLEEIEIYNLTKELQGVGTSLGGTTFERDEHLPAFIWYGPESTKDVAWLLNERFVRSSIIDPPCLMMSQVLLVLISFSGGPGYVFFTTNYDSKYHRLRMSWNETTFP